MPNSEERDPDSEEPVLELDARDETACVLNGRPDFDKLFAPLAVREFFRMRRRDKRPMLFRGPRNRFKSLLDWPDLNRILSHQANQKNSFRLVRDEQAVPLGWVTDQRTGSGFRPFGQHNPMIDHRLLTALRQGATLILQSANLVHPPMQAAVDFFEAQTGRSGRANIYAAWSPTRGFPVHWDTVDSFVFQVAGCKRWYLHGETRPYPLDPDVTPSPAPPAEASWSGVLKPGDLLYIPRGIWHHASLENAEHVGIGSLHFTLHTNPITGKELTQWLLGELSEHERFRDDLPPAGDEAGRRASFRMLKDLIARALDEDAPLRFRSDTLACWSDPQRTTLDFSLEPWKLGEARWNSCELCLRGTRFAELRVPDTGGDFSLAANGHTWTFDGYCLELIRFLVKAGCTSVGEIKRAVSARYSEAFVDEFLQMLIEEGAASVHIPNNSRKKLPP